MQFGVDESALVDSAVAVDRAASALAAVRLDGLGRSVSAAMPGSRSAAPAATVDELLAEVAQAIVRDLLANAEAVRTSGRWYRATEQEVVSAADARARGAA